LTHVLADLEACGRVERVHVAENGENWDGDWYVHAEDITLLEKLAKEWRPRTTLLSPFDNLICDRIRTRHLFGFDYSIEIYTPAAKRKYGYYVLPILHGDQLVGRLCPRMDRQLGRLTIEAVYAERGAPETKKTSRAIAQAIEQLGVFLGAREIVLGRRVPAQWASGLNL
jgi:uncharacterized protein YcaQ